MKMTKKLLVAAVAAITVLGFTGCDLLAGKKSLSDAFQHKSDEANILKYTDQSDLSVWNIEGENESTEEQIRAIQFLQTKHSDMCGLVAMDTNDCGVIGVLFDASREKDEEGNWLYSFGVASVGRSTKGVLPYYYVSYFANVKEANLAKDNFGVTDTKRTAIDPEVKTPYEIVYQKITTFTTAAIVAMTDVDTKTAKTSYKAAIDVDENEDGSYTVKFYGKDVANKADLEAATTIAKDVTMSAASLNKTAAKQAQCGCYAMINKPGTLNGSLTILDLTNDAIVVEE